MTKSRQHHRGGFGGGSVVASALLPLLLLLLFALIISSPASLFVDGGGGESSTRRPPPYDKKSPPAHAPASSLNNRHDSSDERRALNDVVLPPEADHGSEYSLSVLGVNPGRGHYAHTESLASSPSALTASYLEGVRSSGRSVILRVYYLDDFVGTDVIDQTFLDQMVADFETMLVSVVPFEFTILHLS